MDVQEMINSYTDWLNCSFSFIQMGEYYELTTPYLDRNNDHLQIYVKQEPNGTYLLTDDSNTISNLEAAGVSIIKSKKYKYMLERIVRDFGISINGSNLEIQATKSNYPQKQHMLLQAMMAIGDEFYEIS